MRPHVRTSKNRPTPADRYDRALLATRGWGVRPSSSALYIQSEALQDIACHLPQVESGPVGPTVAVLARMAAGGQNWTEAMGYPDPRQAIVTQLAQPRRKPIWQSAPSAGGWRRAISRGGGRDADPDTMRFVKQRGIPGHELHAVAFADRDGRNYRYLVGVVQGAGGWQVKGLAGGGEGDPPRDQPWINFCGWGWPRSFRGGGWVIGSGSKAAARVRLRFRGGPMLEDTVDDGVVLLIADVRVDVPATAEILDASGSLLASHSAF
jgi:hypothetical protein